MKIIANIYDADTSKAAIRRFKTIYHQIRPIWRQHAKIPKKSKQQIRQNNRILQKPTNTQNKQQNRRILQNNTTQPHKKEYIEQEKD